MKNYLPLLFILLTLFSCSNNFEEEAQPEKKLYPVTFDVGSFKQEMADFDKAQASISAENLSLNNYAKYLYYRVYNAEGSLVNSIDQTGMMANFGKISDKLPEGSYTIFFAASAANLSIFTDKVTPFDKSSYGPVWGTWSDTFAKSVSIKVNSAAVTENINLDRVVGAVELILEDEIPQNVDSISVYIDDDASALSLSGNLQGYVGNTNRFIISASEKGKPNWKRSWIVGNTVTPFKMILTAYNSKNQLIISKTVENVRCNVNKKTIVSGKLFGPIETNTNVTVNPDWQTATNQVKF